MRLASDTSSSAVSSGHLADLLEVHAHRVVGRRLDREVELGDDLVLGLGVGAHVPAGALALEDVDAEVGEEVVDAVDLVRRELDVLQRVGDVVAREVALLASLVDEQADLLDAQLAGVDRLVAFFGGVRHVSRPHRHLGVVVHGEGAERLSQAAAHALESRKLLTLPPTVVSSSS